MGLNKEELRKMDRALNGDFSEGERELAEQAKKKSEETVKRPIGHISEEDKQQKFQKALKLASEQRGREARRNRLVDVAAVLYGRTPMTFERAILAAHELEQAADRFLKRMEGGYKTAVTREEMHDAL